MPQPPKKPGYYLRFRGQTTGPYSLQQVLDSLAQGSISRLHDVSRDQTRWFPIHTHPSILASDAPDPAPSSPQPAASAPEQDTTTVNLSSGPAPQSQSGQSSQSGADTSTEDLIDSILREPRK
jgi:hypothetical protein